MRPVRGSILVLVACLLVVGCSNTSSPPAGPRPDILLVSIDTLRADRLGCYGAERDTSPFLDELAAAGARFADVVTPSTNTLVSHKAILRGALPSSFRGAAADFPTLADLLRGAGYETVAFVDGGFLSSRFGQNQGFDLYVDDLASPAPAGGRPVADRRGGGFAAVLPAARRWLERRTPDRPFFMFLHTYDVHCPYEPEERFAALFTAGRAAPLDTAGMCGKSDFRDMELSAETVAWIRDLYDAGIRQADEALGSFIRRLRADGLLNDALIVVISDHGESLGEWEWFGHGRLDPPQIFVPWIVSGPGILPGTVVDAPVHLLDLLPTVLDLLQIPAPSHLAGVSQRAAIQGAENQFQGGAGGRLRVVEIRDSRALLLGPWILEQDLSDGSSRRLYRRDQDVSVDIDRVAAHPDVRDEILARWARLATRLQAAGGELRIDSPALDDRTLQDLRSLGYVD